MERLFDLEDITNRRIKRTSETKTATPLVGLFFDDGTYIVIGAGLDPICAYPEVYTDDLGDRELLELGLIDDREYVLRQEEAARRRDEDTRRRELADLARLSEKYSGVGR